MVRTCRYDPTPILHEHSDPDVDGGSWKGQDWRVRGGSNLPYLPEPLKTRGNMDGRIM